MSAHTELTDRPFTLEELMDKSRVHKDYTRFWDVCHERARAQLKRIPEDTWAALPLTLWDYQNYGIRDDPLSLLVSRQNLDLIPLSVREKIPGKIWHGDSERLGSLCYNGQFDCVPSSILRDMPMKNWLTLAKSLTMFHRRAREFSPAFPHILREEIWKDRFVDFCKVASIIPAMCRTPEVECRLAEFKTRLVQCRFAEVQKKTNPAFGNYRAQFVRL